MHFECAYRVGCVCVVECNMQMDVHVCGGGPRLYFCMCL